jgi:uncharacterized protein (TIGR03545 family)
MATKIFRWKAIIPVLLVVAIVVVLWIVFADRIIKSQIESVGSSTLGTELDLASFQLRESDAAADMGGLQIANPSDPKKNLIEANTITADLVALPAVEKKVVIERLTLSGLRFGTTRKTPARPAPKDSPSRKLWEQTQDWAKQNFALPKIAMQRVDTVKSLVLDPTQLGTVKAAEALAAAADSTRQALTQTFQAIQVKPVVDSATSLANRLAKTDPGKLGVTGVAQAVTDVKRNIDAIEQTKTQVENLEKNVNGAVTTLTQGLKDVDAARQRDYAFAKSLLNLPLVSAPDISQALFGQTSIDYFQQALYYAQLAQKYLPPGLRPLNRPGPKRLRMAGTTVDFPKEHEYPKFLLERGDIDFAFGADTSKGQFKAALTGLTTQPALYGKPATFAATGKIALATPLVVELKGLSDHVGSVPKDQAQAQLRGVPLPKVSVPGLPFSVTPGVGNANFDFALAGDKLSGTWSIQADNAQWGADSASQASFGLVENTIWRVVSGLKQLTVNAELGGTISAPTLKVSSNLDNAIANQLRAIAGEELAKGEAKAKAAVDKIVADKVGPLQAKVDSAKGRAAQQLGLDKKQLDDAQKQLEAQLKRYTGVALPGGIKLPKL